ncbi:MAG: hypothetical protein ACHQII_01675 [Bacteroidia bacterium]
MLKHNSAFLYVVFIVSGYRAMAQATANTVQYNRNNPDHKRTRKPNATPVTGYINFSMGLGENFTHNPPINLTLSFPYTNSNQLNTQQTFTAYKPNMAKKDFRNFDILAMKVGYHRIFAEGAVGVFSMINNSTPDYRKDFNGHLGVGAILPFGGPTKRFTFQASINYCGSSFMVPLGDIDNGGGTITAMGLSATPTFVYQVPKHSGKSTTYTPTVANSSNVHIDLSENQTFIYPKLSFSNNPLTHTFYWAASLSYYIPITQSEYLEFTQQGPSQAAASLGEVSFISSGIKLQNNGKLVNTVPFNTRGFSFMFTVGVNLHIRENFSKIYKTL